MSQPKRTTMVLPDDLRKEARSKAIMEGKSLSQVVRELLTQYVKGDEPEPTKEAQT
jgi:plasmid stability protein